MSGEGRADRVERRALRWAQPEQVAGPLVRRGGAVAQVAGPVHDLVCQRLTGRLDGVDAPVEDLVEAGGQHRQQDRVGPLAHVEADGAGGVGALVVRQPVEPVAAGARDPVFLQRPAVSEPVAEPQRAHSVRPQHPLVAGHRERVGLDLGDRDRQRADRLGPVDDERGAGLTAPRADGGQVEHGPVGPVDVGDGHERRLRADRVEQTRGPPGRPARRAQRARRLDRPDRRARLGGQPPPRVDVARELLGDDHDRLPGFEPAGSGRPSPWRTRRPEPAPRGAAPSGSPTNVATRRRTRSADAEERVRRDVGRDALGADALDAGGLDRPEQRAHVGRVEVVEIRREREEVGAGEHGRSGGAPEAGPRAPPASV